MHSLIGIYGLSGRSQQDALAEVIQENHGHFHYRMSALRDLMLGHVLQSLGYSTSRINAFFRQSPQDAVIPELGVSLKHLATTLEVNWGIERIGYDFWELCATAYIKGLRDEGIPVIVTDLHTVRQAEALLALGAQVFSTPINSSTQPLTGPGIFPLPSSDPDLIISIIETEIAISNADETSVALLHKKRA